MAKCPKCNEEGYITLSPCLACGYLSKYAKQKGQNSSLDIPLTNTAPLSSLDEGAKDSPLPFTSDIKKPIAPENLGAIKGEISKDFINELEKELEEEKTSVSKEIKIKEVIQDKEDDELLLAYKITQGLTKEELSRWFNRDMFYSDTLVRNEEEKKDASSFILLIKSISLIVGAFLVNVFFIYYF